MKPLVRHCLFASLVGLALMLTGHPISGFAADFLLEWNPNSESDLQGYYVYYQEATSVADNPDAAIKVEIPLNTQGFDKDNPSETLTGLNDDTLYYFAVSAYNAAGESDISNEVSLSKSSSGSGNSTDTSDSSGSGGSSGGCFINALH